MLRASGLKKSFGGQTVLDGVDLELRQGEVVLLRGENGSGKTTLLNILTGNLEPDAGGIHYSADDTPRSYRFPRRWWQDLNPWDHFRPEFVAMEGMGRTWQDVRLFRSLRLRDNIAVAEPGHPGENPFVALLAPGRASRREAELNAQADAMLAHLGLAGRESSSGDMVSLGQSKRVAIARAVAAGARILFLDEPLAGLDRQGITDVLALLESLVREEKLILVIVEHVFNQPHLHGLVSTDWLLEGGKLKRNGQGTSRSPVFNLQYPGASRPAWFALLAGAGAEIIDEPLPRGALLTRIRRPDQWKPEAKPILEIKDLVVKRGPRTVIGLDEERNETGFNLTLYQGEIAVLQAPNGWGKSTLFDAICGTLSWASGDIRILGESQHLFKPWRRYDTGLRTMPSNGQLFPSLRASETLQLARSGKQSLFPDGLLNRCGSSLSGGEKKRLAFSCMTTGQVHVLDEPFAAMDGAGTDRLATLLKLRSSLVFEPHADQPPNA